MQQTFSADAVLKIKSRAGKGAAELSFREFLSQAYLCEGTRPTCRSSAV